MYEVRFKFTNSMMKTAKFETIETAKTYINKIKLVAEKNNTNVKIALWDRGWLVESEVF